MSAYYNEIDPYAAQWLRNLIAAGHIASGDVDERSITEVHPDDLRGYTQCHFFAGIGGWSYALRLAGWADDRPVWTGSCPCQPFSAAGKQRGSEDERHLWPAFFRLIRECRPSSVFGEQVAGAAGLAWIDHVCADLEGAGYAAAAAALPACSVGAHHRRERLFWVANSERAEEKRQQQHGMEVLSEQETEGSGCSGILGNSDNAGLARRWQDKNGKNGQQGGRTTIATGSWGDLEWLPCTDGKARPTQPGLFPLAHGLQSCLVRCRDIEAAAIQEVLNAAIDPDPAEAMRLLWRRVRAQIHQWPAGGQGSVPQAEVLLPFLLSLRAACDSTAYGSGGAQANKAVHWRALRFLRLRRRSLHAPRQRQPDGQQGVESTDALHLLSLSLACHAEAFENAATDAYATTDRVGRLRAYGNAIVPAVGAAFIQAVM
jgi:DNA (cytosine-5)-methyltransferase 1